MAFVECGYNFCAALLDFLGVEMGMHGAILWVGSGLARGGMVWLRSVEVARVTCGDGGWYGGVEVQVELSMSNIDRSDKSGSHKIS